MLFWCRTIQKSFILDLISLLTINFDEADFEKMLVNYVYWFRKQHKFSLEIGMKGFTL